MAKERPEYEVNEEFNKMAFQIIEKYPDHFYGAKVDQVCCVNIINKERTKTALWQLKAVKMPEALHNTYSYYVVLHSSDWDELNNKQKLAVVADVLHGIPKDELSEGNVIKCDTKGYASMFRTFKGIDFLDDPDLPDILEEKIEWKK